MSLRQRRLRVIDYPWHQVHLYRLTALPADFWLARIRSPLWNYLQRPEPRNYRGGLTVDQIEARINRRRLDLSLLHLDQWCDRDPVRAFPFRLMRSLTRDLPQVLIMHGTPDDPDNRRRILKLIGDLPVVCNSEQAREEWDGGEEREDRYGRPQFTTVIHGYKTDEFLNFPVWERRREAITICSGGDLSRWYHGTAIVERLMRDVNLHWVGPLGDRPWCHSYSEYKKMLASSLIYFSPTRRAPMPGSRTEAALSGCCIVSVPGNDWESGVVHGVNGYDLESYESIRDCLRYLIAHPSKAHMVGQEGRKRALKAYEHTRYVREWMGLLSEIGVCQ